MSIDCIDGGCVATSAAMLKESQDFVAQEVGKLIDELPVAQDAVAGSQWMPEGVGENINVTG